MYDILCACGRHYKRWKEFELTDVSSLEARGNSLFFLRSVLAMMATSSPLSLMIGNLPETSTLRYVARHALAVVVKVVDVLTLILRSHFVARIHGRPTFFTLLKDVIGFFESDTVRSNDEILYLRHDLHAFVNKDEYWDQDRAQCEKKIMLLSMNSMSRRFRSSGMGAQNVWRRRA